MKEDQVEEERDHQFVTITFEMSMKSPNGDTGKLCLAGTPKVAPRGCDIHAEGRAFPGRKALSEKRSFRALSEEL